MTQLINMVLSGKNIKRAGIVSFIIITGIGVLRIVVPPQIHIIEKTHDIPVTEIPVSRPPITGIRVTVNFSEGRILFSDVQAINTYEALKRITEKNTINIETEKTDIGMRVKKVGDRENSQSMVWDVYLNGLKRGEDPETVKVNPGDRVEWKYEKRI